MLENNKMRLAKISCLLVLSFLVACGDATRNSGGTSFTFFGWFADATGTEGASARITSFNTLVADSALFAGLQNNLAGQGITVDVVKNSYYIPGSTVSIPDTIFPINAFLRPTALGDEGNFGNAVSTLPEGVFTGDNVSYTQTLLVTPQIAEFLTLNREAFPQFPFDLIVTTSIEGVTTAGQRVETNAVTFNFAIDSDLAINGGFAVDADADADADADVDAVVIAADDDSSDDAEVTVTGATDGDITFF